MIPGSRHVQPPPTALSATPPVRQPLRCVTIDWTLVQTLLIASEAGSYRAAAKTASLNTIRKRVAELERKIGISLLTTSVTGVVPTDAGLLLIQTARAMRAALDEGLETDFQIEREQGNV